MFVGLDEYGKYKIYKSSEVLVKNKDKFKYCVFDCSTELKGPLHTLVKSCDIVASPEVVKVDVTMSYVGADIPWKDTFNKVYEYKIGSKSELYALASMMYQYEAFNLFMYDHLTECTEEIDITELKLYCQKSASKEETVDILHYYYDCPCSFLKDFLKVHGMNVSTWKVLKNKFLCLMSNGEYVISKTIPENTKYVGVPVMAAESFYIISYKKFFRFHHITDIEFAICANNYDYILNGSDSTILVDFYLGGGISSLYSGMLFIPQFVLMQREFRDNKDIDISINITCNDVNFDVYATKYDVAKGISLFKIIDNITKI